MSKDQSQRTETLGEFLRKATSLKLVRFFRTGKEMITSADYVATQEKVRREREKTPSRTAVINYLLGRYERETTYLEIGVRDPAANFAHIRANRKYAVDPGVEFAANPVDFALTSDEFFRQMDQNELSIADLRFDVIFIDGLHLAEQVDRDIDNALRHLQPDGFIVLHDCNPPSEWHARENHDYHYTPALGSWNGTSWKAFVKWRGDPRVAACCIDTDWGVGVIAKSHPLGHPSPPPPNEFFEYAVFADQRTAMLNLVSFAAFRALLEA